MRKSILAIISVILCLSCISVYCYNTDLDVVKSNAIQYEGNIVKFAETGWWQYNDIPLSIPEGADESFRVTPEEPLGEVIDAEITYFYSLDGTVLYQCYNAGNSIYIAEYNTDGIIMRVDGWEYK